MAALHEDRELNTKERSTLSAISGYKIIIPIVLGIGVIAYLLWRQFDWSQLQTIDWKMSVLVWMGVAFLIYVIRHLVLSWRLKMLSENEFSWRKSIELIFIWEFSSAVSPTAIGGTAVALLLLAQERLKPSRAITIIIYSIVVDTAFFIISFLLLFLLAGPGIIGPDATSYQNLGNYSFSFFAVFGLMFSYGAFLFYGLFIDPKRIKAFICFFGRLPWLRRYKKYFQKTGDGIITASSELAHKNWWYHLKIFTATSLAWFLRFAVVNAIIIGLIATMKTDFLSQTLLYGRNQNMYMQTAFTPTPGASGFSEIMFGGMYSDFVPLGLALLVAIIWRLITYYSYLFAGMIVVPNWVRKLIIRRRKAYKQTLELPERFE